MITLREGRISMTDNSVLTKPDVNEVMKMLGLIDLTIIREQLFRDIQLDWTQLHATEVEIEYRRFFALATALSIDLVPSPDIDIFWQRHILDINFYRATCNLIRDGNILPFSSDSPETPARRSTMYIKTLNIYRSNFGNPNPNVWCSRDPDCSPYTGCEHY